MLADGATAGEHADSAARQFARLGLKIPAAAAAPELGPALPVEAAYLWAWWTELALGLPLSGMAPPVVTWDVLRAWSRQMQVELEPWESLTLVRLGSTRAAIISEHNEKKTKR